MRLLTSFRVSSRFVEAAFLLKPVLLTTVFRPLLTSSVVPLDSLLPTLLCLPLLVLRTTSTSSVRALVGRLVPPALAKSSKPLVAYYIVLDSFGSIVCISCSNTKAAFRYILRDSLKSLVNICGSSRRSLGESPAPTRVAEGRCRFLLSFAKSVDVANDISELVLRRMDRSSSRTAQ